METIKLYMFEEEGKIAVVIVAKDINEAMSNFQAFVNDINQTRPYKQALHLLPSTSDSDYQVEVYENYTPAGLQQVLTQDMISTVYDVYEFDFVVGRVYGLV